VPSKRKFFKTVFKVIVLSEDALVNASLAEVAYMITEGDCSGDVSTESTEELTAKQAAEELQAQGSSPEFFMLDEDGNNK
jgi:hypothetical protein